MIRVERGDARWGIPEDPDFDERFRRHRVARWIRGVRNGMSLRSLLGFRLGVSNEIRFHGVAVRQSPNQATYRLIEDIWMRGEYDLPGVVPQPGWRVVDVGANVGIYAMLAASRGARVTAYEPGPAAFERLQANTAAWQVQCHHAAVVGVPQRSVRLFLHPVRDTRNTMLGDRGGVSNRARAEGVVPPVSFAGSVEVPAVTMQDVLATPCDLLKIACEGAEFELLAHAGPQLRHAARIVMELHGEFTTEHGDAAEAVQRVRDAGFDVAVTTPYPGTSRRFLTAARR